MKTVKKKNIADPTFRPCHLHAYNLPIKEFNESSKLISLVKKYFNKGIFARGSSHKETKKKLCECLQILSFQIARTIEAGA